MTTELMTPNSPESSAEPGIDVQRIVRHYDYWIRPCEHCGHDEGRSTLPKKGNHRCWKCGRRVQRDFSDRALKPEFQANVEGEHSEPKRDD